MFGVVDSLDESAEVNVQIESVQVGDDDFRDFVMVTVYADDGSASSVLLDYSATTALSAALKNFSLSIS